jgi:CubicO group peptidase (beta-lactamase class C family)
MKKVIYSLFAIVGLIGLACLLAFISGNGHLIKAVVNTYLVGRKGPSINEYSIFDNRIVKAADESYSWEERSSIKHRNSLSAAEEQTHQKYESVAFLVIKNDSILFEKYWDGYTDSSLSNTFSVAKSFIGLLIGAAIQDGYIKSTNDPVANYLPEFATAGKKKITIHHLLQMTSGLDFGESYGNPFGFMAKAYYGNNLYELTVEKPLVNSPGAVWAYQGGNTLLLSFIIEKATGKSVSDYFSERIWQKIGSKHDALWNLDKPEGREKAFCCFYSNARDFAKIGKLYHKNGSFNNEQLIPLSYILASKKPVNTPDKKGRIVDYYGYQWWQTNYDGEKIYYARGILGQYIVVLPKEELIFVRLGNLRDEEKVNNVPIDLIEYIKMAKRLK